eukprot:3644898-Prymnesium_polylepis.1
MRMRVPPARCTHRRPRASPAPNPPWRRRAHRTARLPPARGRQARDRRQECGEPSWAVPRRVALVRLQPRAPQLDRGTTPRSQCRAAKVSHPRTPRRMPEAPESGRRSVAPRSPSPRAPGLPPLPTPQSRAAAPPAPDASTLERHASQGAEARAGAPSCQRAIPQARMHRASRRALRRVAAPL